MKVVFRGDGRSPEPIKRVDGTVPQTRVVSLPTSRNFDNVWHPWNDTKRGNLVYFRKGPNQDNCLFSAISVTPNFEVASKFPLLSESQSTNPGAIGKAMADLVPSANVPCSPALRQCAPGRRAPRCRASAPTSL